MLLIMEMEQLQFNGRLPTQLPDHSVASNPLGTTGITIHDRLLSALPVNNTSSEIAAVVASQLNSAFSDNKIYRTASKCSW